MYYLPVTNQDWINQWPQGCSSLMTGKCSYLLYQPRVQMSLSINRRFSQSLLRYIRYWGVLSPEWKIQLTQHSPQTQMTKFYTFSLQKGKISNCGILKRKVYPCITTLKVLPFTRYIFQIRPDQEQDLISFTTELNMPVVDAQSVASTSGHFLRQKFWTESESCHQLGVMCHMWSAPLGQRSFMITKNYWTKPRSNHLCAVKPIYWHHVVVKDGTIFVAGHQASRMDNSCWKHQDSPKAFRKGVLKAVYEGGGCSVYIISLCIISWIGW